MRFLRALRDYLEYFVIPMMAIFMPWWLAIKFFRLMARVPFLYRVNATRALVGTQQLDLGLVDDAARANWVHSFKVGQMIEHADIFLLYVGRKGYWEKYVDQNIADLLKPQQIMFTPHYGAGMWVYWYLQQRNCKAIMFVNLPDKELNALNLLGRLRLVVLRRLGAEIISPDNLLALRKALSLKSTIIVGPDVPVDSHVAAFQPKTELGRLNLTSRFFELAEKRNIPVLNIIFSVDVVTGRREFEAFALATQTAFAYADSFAQVTVAAIKKRSYLWHMCDMTPQVLLND